MRLGIALPQFGPFADPRAIPGFAAEVESLGYDSVWVGERVHAPSQPLSRYPSDSGVMPEEFRRGVDPLLALTVAATATTRVRLGSSTLSAPLRPALLLARSLTGIDVLSGGRLNVGLGLSWSRDEYDAVGVPWEQRGARLDETLDVLRAVWSLDPVEHRGRFATISSGEFQPKPVQRTPPIYLGGFSQPALRRTAHRADGWLGIALEPKALRTVLDSLRQAAERADRAPVDTVIRINPTITGTPSGPTTGPVEHLCGYLRELAELGVGEAFVDFQMTTGDGSELLDMAARLRAGYQG